MGCCQAKQKQDVQPKRIEKKAEQKQPNGDEVPALQLQKEEETNQPQPLHKDEKQPQKKLQNKEQQIQKQINDVVIGKQLNNDNVIKEDSEIIEQDDQSQIIHPSISIQKVNSSNRSIVHNNKLIKNKSLVLNDIQIEISDSKSSSQINNNSYEDQENKPQRKNIFNKNRDKNLNDLNPVSENKQIDQVKLLEKIPQSLEIQKRLLEAIQQDDCLQIKSICFQDSYQVSILEQIRINKDGYMHSILHIAISKNNLDLLKCFINEVGVNLAHTLYIIQERVMKKLDIIHTIELALEQQNADMIKYLINICCPLLQGDIFTYLFHIINSSTQQANKFELQKALINNDYFKLCCYNLSLEFRQQWISSILKIIDINEDLYQYDQGVCKIIDLSKLSSEQRGIIELINKQQIPLQNQVNMKQDFLKALQDKNMDQLKSIELQDYLKYNLIQTVYREEDIINMESIQKGLQSYSPIFICLCNNDLDKLSFLLETSKGNFNQLISIFQGTQATNQFYSFYEYIFSNKDPLFFKKILEQPLLNKFLMNQELFLIIFELLVEKSFNTEIDDFIITLLQSKSSHQLFNRLTFFDKFQFIEQLMLSRGKAITSLVEYMEYNVQQDDREFYFQEKSQNLANLFFLVYEQIAFQPYSMYFFKLFPEVMLQLELSNDDSMLNILEKARENINDQDMNIFLWYQPEFSFKIIKNYIEQGQDNISKFERIIGPFIVSLKDNCDQKKLQKYLEQSKVEIK